MKNWRHILAHESPEKQGNAGDIIGLDRVECAFFKTRALTVETNHIFQQIEDLKSRVELLRGYL